MKRYEYYVLHDTGAKVKVRPNLPSTYYDAYTIMSADEGYVLKHKMTGKRARDIEVLSGFANLWEEVKDNPV